MIENSLNEVALLEVACVRTVAGGSCVYSHPHRNKQDQNKRHTNGLFRVIDPRVRLIYPASKNVVSGRQKDFTSASFILYKTLGAQELFKHPKAITPFFQQTHCPCAIGDLCHKIMLNEARSLYISGRMNMFFVKHISSCSKSRNKQFIPSQWE